MDTSALTVVLLLCSGLLMPMQTKSGVPLPCLPVQAAHFSALDQKVLSLPAGQGRGGRSDSETQVQGDGGHTAS